VTAKTERISAEEEEQLKTAQQTKATYSIG